MPCWRSIRKDPNLERGRATVSWMGSHHRAGVAVAGAGVGVDVAAVERHPSVTGRTHDDLSQASSSREKEVTWAEVHRRTGRLDTGRARSGYRVGRRDRQSCRLRHRTPVLYSRDESRTTKFY